MGDNPKASKGNVESYIREHAYYLWLADGMPHGRHLEYWHQACRDIVDLIVSQALLSHDPMTVSDHSASPRSIPLQITAHVANLGDLESTSGGWAGVPESQMSIEGFEIHLNMPATSITYKILWTDSTMSEDTLPDEYCGSRGLGRPIMGFLISVDDALTQFMSIIGEARFIDGTHVSPVQAGVLCRATSGSALEAFRLTLVEGASPSTPSKRF